MPPQPRQGPIASWAAQMVGTVVVAIMVLAFVKTMGAPFPRPADELQRYVMSAILGAAVPAIFYLRPFKARLNADEAAMRASGGAPDPRARAALMRSLAIGGALCDLPMAVGALHLFFGGDSRWFVGAALVTIAVRLSYRPFLKLAR